MPSWRGGMRGRKGPAWGGGTRIARRPARPRWPGTRAGSGRAPGRLLGKRGGARKRGGGLSSGATGSTALRGGREDEGGAQQGTSASRAGAGDGGVGGFTSTRAATAEEIDAEAVGGGGDPHEVDDPVKAPEHWARARGRHQGPRAVADRCVGEGVENVRSVDALCAAATAGKGGSAAGRGRVGAVIPGWSGHGRVGAVIAGLVQSWPGWRRSQSRPMDTDRGGIGHGRSTRTQITAGPRDQTASSRTSRSPQFPRPLS
jgi:hypothetical protein